jgi:type I restriction enzyme S subunit
MKKGLQTKKLGDVCDFEGGSQPPKSEFIYDEKPGYVRFLQIRDFGSDKNITYIRHSKKNRLCDENDILIGRYGASVGKILTGKAGSYNVALMKTLPNLEVLDQSWFYHFLISDEFQKPLLNVADRSAQAGFSKDDIYNFPVPLPPLPEQQRIVGLLDEAFEGLATAKANAEKNLQNARALFESHLQSVFTQRGPGWVEKTLEDIADADCSLSYGIVQPGDEFDEGMPIVRPTDLTTKIIRLGGLKRIDPKLAGGYKRTALQGGELLLCVRGSTGVVSIASPELVGANVTRGIVPIRFNRSLLLPEFGFYLISGGPVQSQIREKTYGTALMQINIRDLRVITFSVPPLQEQKRLAANLDDLHEETQRLARLYERKLAALEALKKSLLHQAFTGEL